MKIGQLAAITWTIREAMGTEAQVAESMRRLRAIGYQAVQISSTPVEYAAVRRILDGEGIACCATHEDGRAIVEEPERVADRVAVLGAGTAAFPHPGGFPLRTAGDARALAAKLNRAGEAMAARGVRLAYHNHALELAREGDSPTFLEILYAETDPRFLRAELDTYWIQAGGGSPEAWARRMAGRMEAIHLKDYAVDPDQTPRFAELGRGNLELPAIVAAAEEGGCQWFVVEQDTTPGDPFDSLAVSFEYAKRHLASEG